MSVVLQEYLCTGALPLEKGEVEALAARPHSPTTSVINYPVASACGEGLEMCCQERAGQSEPYRARLRIRAFVLWPGTTLVDGTPEIHTKTTELTFLISYNSDPIYIIPIVSEEFSSECSNFSLKIWPRDRFIQQFDDRNL